MDGRFLELIRKYLETGILDAKTLQIKKTTRGIPPGGILSPVLSNIVLHCFDEYMQRQIKKYTKGSQIFRSNPLEYKRIEYRRRKSESRLERKKLLLEMRRIGNVNKFDPFLKRMKYIRYADDFFILTIGTKNEAIMIKNNAKEFLKEMCGVMLKTEKTLITNLQDDKLQFLRSGALIVKLKRTTFLRDMKTSKKGVATARIQIKAPCNSLLRKLKDAGFVRQNHDQVFLPSHMGSLTNLSHNDIIAYYNSKIYGILNFFSFSNLNKLGRII